MQKPSSVTSVTAHGHKLEVIWTPNGLSIRLDDADYQSGEGHVDMREYASTHGDARGFCASASGPEAWKVKL